MINLASRSDSERKYVLRSFAEGQVVRLHGSPSCRLR